MPNTPAYTTHTDSSTFFRLKPCSEAPNKMLTHNLLLMESEVENICDVLVSGHTHPMQSFSFPSHQHSLPPSLLPTEGVEGQMSSEEEEARRIAEMGKPILGEHSRLEVVIEESYEFKVHSSFSSPGLLSAFFEFFCCTQCKSIKSRRQANCHRQYPSPEVFVFYCSYSNVLKINIFSLSNFKTYY